MSLIEKLNKIQVNLNAPKNQLNAFAKFNYRNCEDILQALKPILDGCIVTLSDDIKVFGDRVYVHATATIRDGDESIEVSAFAREALNKKGMDDAQVTGSTSSYARKYALNGLFLIDDNKDADSVDNSVNAEINLTDNDMKWIVAYKHDKSVLDRVDDENYKQFIIKEAAK